GSMAAVAVLALLTLSSGALAQTKLKGFGKTVVIDILEGFVSSQDVAIYRGTTVVWTNVTAKSVAINFGMGKQVKQACVAPTGFQLSGNVYSAPNVRPGGVASLCFVQPGTYSYTVIPEGGMGGEGGPPPRGIITVVKDNPA
ncbi:MAG: hypothetical protein ACE5IM_04215, partial [Nitrospinota bacterium]